MDKQTGQKLYAPDISMKGHKNYLAKPITRRQMLDSLKLKEFADDNFKFDENGRKLSKLVENTVEKGEIAHYEQFLLFLQCFQKACFPRVSKGVIVWEWVNISFINIVIAVTEEGRSLPQNIVRTETWLSTHPVVLL